MQTQLAICVGMNLSTLIYTSFILQVPSIIMSLICSSQYLLKSKTYEFPSNAIFSRPLWLNTSWVQTFSCSTLFLNTISRCSSQRMRDQVSHPHKIKAKLQLCVYIYINHHIIRMSGDTKDTELIHTKY